MKISTILLAFSLSLSLVAATLAEKRLAIVNGEYDLSQLQEVMSTESNPILRKTALRKMSEYGREAVDFLGNVVRTDEDAQIRQNALLVIWKICGDDLDHALVMDCIQGEDDVLREKAASIYFGQNPLAPERMAEALQLLQTVQDLQVRSILFQATWPFHRNVTLLKNRADWDHEVELAQEFPLPLDGWAFHLDPKMDMHLTEKCYQPDYDDSEWAKISIGKIWEECGYEGYDGIAWYRITFDAPARPEICNAAELHFGSVDESAWVWLNGQYVGEHNIGSIGWDIPFSLDVSDLIRWGEPNQITVRVQDVAHAGGIYKPVELQIMK